MAVAPAWEIRGWALKEKLDKEKEEKRANSMIDPTLLDIWTVRFGAD